MEYAIHINKLEKIEYYTDKYTRIYYGDEFCPHRGISLAEVKKVVEFCRENHKDLTLVTSYITENNRSKIEQILSYLYKEHVQCEFVINDWGLLYFINANYSGNFRLVLGCLLNKMKKSPVVMNIIGKVEENVKNALKTSSINLLPTQEILRQQNIERVEFENSLQENITSGSLSFEKTLRYPYVFITTARKCVTNYTVEKLNHYNIEKCCHSCDNTYFSLYNRIMGRELIQKGNTLFYENDILPNNFEKQFSRLVCNQFIVKDEEAKRVI